MGWIKKSEWVIVDFMKGSHFFTEIKCLGFPSHVSVVVDVIGKSWFLQLSQVCRYHDLVTWPTGQPCAQCSIVACVLWYAPLAHEGIYKWCSSGPTYPLLVGVHISDAKIIFLQQVEVVADEVKQILAFRISLWKRWNKFNGKQSHEKKNEESLHVIPDGSVLTSESMNRPADLISWY